MLLRLKFHPIIHKMKLKEILHLKFKLLDSKKNRLFLVLFMLVYSVLFLNIFIPFNIKNWMPLSNSPQFLTLSGFGLVGAMGLSFSQFIMRKWFKQEQFIIKQFLIWVLFELLFLTLILTIIYNDISNWFNFFDEFIFILRHTFLIIIIPYSIVLLILSVFHSKSELLALKKNSYKNDIKSDLLKFPDENGNIKFTLPLKDFLYLESTDNYVYIYYQANDVLNKELLRNSLKNLASILKNDPIKRCHRSYMVNLINLNIAKKTGQKISLKLNFVPELIPVSKTYQKEFINYFKLEN